MPSLTLPTYHGFFERIRNLGPTVVFVASFILMVVSIVGIVVAFSIYRIQGPNASVGTSQSLILFTVRT
jgi:hypothetical protein